MLFRSLDRDAKAVAQAIAAIPGARDVTTQSQPGTPQLEFRLDPQRIAQKGLHTTDVLDLIRTFYGGLEVGQVVEEGRVIPLVAIASGEQRTALHRIHQLRFPMADGGWFRLADVADVPAAPAASVDAPAETPAKPDTPAQPE